MTNINNLERQHKDIYEIIHQTMALIDSGNFEEDAMTIARHISALAGKLKIHLNSEDKYLYPALMEKGNETLKVKTEKYIHEMGSLSQTYLAFKDQYNTKSKILSDQAAFKSASKKVFQAVLDRMHKEDTDLYADAKCYL